MPQVLAARVLIGKEEMKSTLRETTVALGGAELFDEIRALRELVISDFYKAVASEYIEANTYRCAYKPMVELLLHEMRYAATAPGWTTEMRKRHIAEAMELAGF